MKRLLIAGGCGFMGSHFVRSMLSKTDLKVINVDKLTYAGNLENLKGIVDSDHYCFVRGDISDQSFVDDLYAKERPNIVINFAAESHVDRSILDPTPFFRTNTLGVQVLLEKSRKYGIERFIQVSTDEVYGDREDGLACDEKQYLNPTNPYAVSKAGGDLISLMYANTYGLPVLIVRSCNNYGPFQFPEKLIPFMIKSIMLGHALPLYGDGLQRREWIYVEDCIEAIWRVLESGEDGAIYNVTAQDERTNLDVIHSLCKLAGDEMKVDANKLSEHIEFISDRPSHDRRYAMSAEKIRTALMWRPAISFEDGLRKTICWYISHKEWVERVTSGEYRHYYDAVYTRAWGKNG